jgi:hypothetical protein
MSKSKIQMPPWGYIIPGGLTRGFLNEPLSSELSPYRGFYEANIYLNYNNFIPKKSSATMC